LSIIRELVEEHTAKTLRGDPLDDSGSMVGKAAAAKGGGGEGSERAAFLTGLAIAVAAVALLALVRRKA